MVSVVFALMSFVVALIVSTLIIYFVTSLFGENEGITTAVLAALIGTTVYTLFYSVAGFGFAASFVAGIVWLLALQKLYSIGWIKSFVIAVVIWIVASIAASFLPALTGPI